MATDYLNPANLNFPTDRFGLTKDVKKDFKIMVRRMHGDPDKWDVYIETMKVLTKHAKARYNQQYELRHPSTTTTTETASADESASTEDSTENESDADSGESSTDEG